MISLTKQEAICDLIYEYCDEYYEPRGIDRREFFFKKKLEKICCEKDKNDSCKL